MNRKNAFIAKLGNKIGVAHKVEEDSYVFQPYDQRTWSSASKDTHHLSEFIKAEEEDKDYFIIHTFVWGKVIKLHKIGNFQFIEANDENRKEVLFHIYIDHDDKCIAAETLDEALILALSYKYDGANSQAGVMFTRMLNIEKYKENLGGVNG